MPILIIIPYRRLLKQTIFSLLSLSGTPIQIDIQRIFRGGISGYNPINDRLTPVNGRVVSVWIMLFEFETIAPIVHEIVDQNAVGGVWVYGCAIRQLMAANGRHPANHRLTALDVLY